jgi:hypothetical protein
MDEWKNPLTGEFLETKHHYFWWWRIFNRRVEKYDPHIDYELELLKLIERT